MLSANVLSDMDGLTINVCYPRGITQVFRLLCTNLCCRDDIDRITTVQPSREGNPLFRRCVDIVAVIEIRVRQAFRGR